MATRGKVALGRGQHGRKGLPPPLPSAATVAGTVLAGVKYLADMDYHHVFGGREMVSVLKEERLRGVGTEVARRRLLGG